MKKFFLGTLFCLILLIFIGLALLPTFVSTSFGKKIAVEFVNKSIPGKIDVEKVHLSWFGKQKFENFALKNRDGKEIAVCSYFETKTPLLYLVFGGRKLDGIFMQSPYLYLEQKEVNKETNVEEALGKKRDPSIKRTNFFKRLKAKRVVVEKGTFIFSSTHIKPIVITDLRLEKKKKPNTFYLQAKTRQDFVQGNVLVRATYDKNLNVKADIQNFPIALFDQLNESTLFTEAIGHTLNASLDVNKEKNSFYINANLESPNLNGFLKGETFDQKLYLNPESNLQFTLTPGLFNQIVTPSQRKEWSLVSKTDLNFTIQKGLIPLNYEKWNLRDIILQAQANLERAEIHHRDLGSYSLNHFDLNIISALNLELTYKGEIRGKEATQIEGNCSITPDKKVLFNTNITGFPISLIEMVSPETAERLNLVFGKNLDLTAYGTYLDQDLDSQFTLSSPLVEVKGTIEGSFPEYTFDLDGNVNIQGEKAKLLGQSADIVMAGDCDLSQHNLVIPLVNGRLSNPQFDIEFRGKLGQRGEAFQSNQVHLVANGKIKQLLTLEKYPINEGFITLNLDGSKNQLFGKMFGTFSDKLSELRFEMKEFLKDNKLDLENAKTLFDFNFTELPVVLLHPFLPEDFNLSLLIGELANLNGNGKLFLGENPHAQVDVDAKATGFSSKLSFDIDKSLKTSLTKPGHIHWEMTPERYYHLLTSFHLDPNYHPKYLLVKTAPIDLKISKMDWTSAESKNIKGFLCKSGLDAEVLIGSLVFKRQETNETFIVQDIVGSLDGENICQTLNLALEGNLSAPNIPHNKNSAFTLKGQVLNLCTTSGKFNHETMTFKGELDLDHLPVRQLTEVVPMDDVTRKKIQAVLGELVNARISGEVSNMSGPVNIDLKASNFKAFLPLQLTPNAIYLRDYVNAEITLTEQVNEVLLKDINPIVITGAYSDNPVKIYISPQGFVLPINPYHLQGLQIENAVIDIGKIRVRNGGQIQSLMEFLKVKDISHDRVMEAWFTPIYMSLHNGVASYKRFDMLLASTVHIALWGNVNLLNDNVNMILGIAPSTLKTRFNVGFSKQELFQVKMRGTADHLDMDWSSASTRIGALIAKSAGGAYGLIGSIIEQFLGEEISPAPTTTPFPWQK